MVQQQYPVNNTIITNSTSIIGYTEVTVDQLVSIFISRGSTKVDWARRLAPIYIQYGKLFNIRADIAWAQMCHETAFLEFTGDVKPEQNNFVGLVLQAEVHLETVLPRKSWVLLHIMHILHGIIIPTHVNEYCNIHMIQGIGSSHYNYTGDTTIGFLNGRWAPANLYR